MMNKQRCTFQVYSRSEECWRGSQREIFPAQTCWGDHRRWGRLAAAVDQCQWRRGYFALRSAVVQSLSDTITDAVLKPLPRRSNLAAVESKDLLVLDDGLDLDVFRWRTTL